MLFSSITFLYYFLPITIGLYFLAPKRFRNGILLVVSLFFYGWGEPKYVFLMIFQILLAYVIGIFLAKATNQKKKKLILTSGVAISLGILGYFKYADFFIGNFNNIANMEIPFLKYALPIGISFYTFQIVSYMVDVYRGTAESQKNVVNLGAYITMFPQLIAGPILRYADVAKQLQYRESNMDDIAAGIRRFLLGLGKKVLIANVIGELCEIFRASQDKTILFFWIYAIANALQIYFDFSGYSDMAIGLGRIFGFHFLENFDYPFISRSITEFWRRWHMSLGTWFRDYVYIPLGGNRVKKAKWYRNIIVVWFLTGFWHGAAWNFIVWGLFFCVLLILEKNFFLKWMGKSKILSRFYVLLSIIISFMIFSATDMSEAMHYLKCMFGIGKIPLVSAESLYYLKSYGVILTVACIGATPLMKNLILKIQGTGKRKWIQDIAEIGFLLILLIVVTSYLVDGSFNPFLYFRF